MSQTSQTGNHKPNRDKLVAYLLMGAFVLVSIFLIIFQFIRGETGFAVRGFLFPIFLFIPPIFKKLGLNHSWRLYIFGYLFIIFAFNYGCIYGVFTWDQTIDKVSHFISGFLFTILGLCFYCVFSGPAREGLRAPTAMAASWALGFSSFIAVFWEVLEFFDYNILGNDSQKHLTTGVFDTMYDLICCLIGTVLSILSFILWRKKGIKLLTGWICEEFFAVNGGERKK